MFVAMFYPKQPPGAFLKNLAKNGRSCQPQLASGISSCFFVAGGYLRPWIVWAENMANSPLARWSRNLARAHYQMLLVAEPNYVPVWEISRWWLQWCFSDLFDFHHLFENMNLFWPFFGDGWLTIETSNNYRAWRVFREVTVIHQIPDAPGMEYIGLNW